MKKKLLFTIISLIVVIGTVIGLIVPSFSAPEDVYDEELNNINEPVRAGAVGEVYWKVASGVLYLRNDATSGYTKVNETNINAATTDNYTTNIPWGSSAKTITKVVIENEIRPTNTNYYFYKMSKLATIENIANLNTSNVTDMEDMFNGCSNLTQLDLSNFDTSQVTNMRYMFYGCSNLTQLDLRSFNTSNVTDMGWMFSGCSNLTQLDLSNFYTSNVTDMPYMFYGCSNLIQLDVSNFDTSNVTRMFSMFDGCSRLTTLDLSSFNTSNVTDMDYMFSGCSNLTQLDLSNFDTSKVTEMRFMFNGCSKLTQLNVSSFDTSNVTNMRSMFDGCRNLTQLDVSNFDTSKVTNMSYMFSYCSKLTQLDLSSFNTSNVTDMRYMFSGCSKLTTLNVSSFNTSQVTDMRGMFDGCSNLTQLDLSSFNTSKVTDMGWMFNGCSNLTQLDLSKFDTSNVTNMGWMFAGCRNLTQLDLSNFNTSKVTDMGYMFGWCASLDTLDVSSFDTSKVTDMSCMFLSLGKLATLNISNFNTSQVTDMGGMFAGCSKLTTLNVSSFDTSQVTDMRSMFDGCGNLTQLDLSNFNTSKVTNMSYMFLSLGKLATLNISNFNVSKVTNMTGMYNGCEFTTLYTPKTGTKTEALPYTMYDTAGVSYTQSTINKVLYKIDPTIGRIYWKVASGVLYLRNDAQTGYAKVNETNINAATTANYTTNVPWGSSAGTITKVVVENKIQPTKLNLYFYNMSKLTTIDNINNFNTSNVTNMSYMFANSGFITLNISSFDVGKVTTMTGMYNGCKFTTLYTPKTGTKTEALPYTMYDTAGTSYTQSTINRVLYKIDPTIGRIYWKVASGVLYLRNDAQSGYAKVDEAKVNTAVGSNYTTTIPWGSSAGTITKVVIENEIRPTTTRSYFIYMQKLTTIENLSKLNTTNVTNMYGMFFRCDSIAKLDLRSFNTSKVTNMSYMFGGCANLDTLDVSSFDTSKVTDMSYMFLNLGKLATLNISNFNVSKVTNMTGMYNGCKFTTLYTPKTGTKTEALPYTMYDTSYNEYSESTIDRVLYKELGVYWKVESGVLYLRNNATSGYAKVDEAKVNDAEVYNYTASIPWGSSAGTITKVVIENEIRPTNTNYYFYKMSKLATIENIKNLNTSNVTNMGYMFSGCSSLSALDLSGFNTSNVTNMTSMFSGCSLIKRLELGNFETPKLEYSKGMFDNCTSLNYLDISNLDLSKIKRIRFSTSTPEPPTTNSSGVTLFNGTNNIATIKTPKNLRNDVPLNNVMKDTNNKLYIFMPKSKTLTIKRNDIASNNYTGTYVDKYGIKYSDKTYISYSVENKDNSNGKYSNLYSINELNIDPALLNKIKNVIAYGYPYETDYTSLSGLGQPGGFTDQAGAISSMKSVTQTLLDYYFYEKVQEVLPSKSYSVLNDIYKKVENNNGLVNNSVDLSFAISNSSTISDRIVLNSLVSPILVFKLDDNSSRVIGARLRIVNKDGSTVTGGFINGSSVNDVLFESSNINTLVNLPLGEYILKEVYTPTGYKRASDISFSVTSSNINTGQYITMIDTKTNETTRDLKISNKLEGKYAEYDREFRISININTQETRNLNATIYRKNNTEENVVIKTKEESIFTLAHDEYIIIKEVPQGVSYSVVQLEDTGYVVTYKEGSTSNIINSNIYNGRVMDYSDINELEITNTRQVSIETGIVVSIIPFITLLLIATAMFILYKKSYIIV